MTLPILTLKESFQLVTTHIARTEILGFMGVIGVFNFNGLVIYTCIILKQPFNEMLFATAFSVIMGTLAACLGLKTWADAKANSLTTTN